MDSPFGHPTVAEAIARIEQRNRVVSAVLRPMLAAARRRAAEVADATPRSPLHGVPYVLKDTWDTAGIPTTAGSWRHRDRIPPASASVHLALEEAGAVLLGKSSCSDLALAPDCSNYLVGSTRNPHDLSRTSGGSTGGGAAAVADGMAAFDWGSDFGGSIRMPSAFCGVAGLRLSSAAWPADEHFPFVPPPLSSLVGMGPVARTVAGCRVLVETLAPRLRKAQLPRFSARGLAVLSPDGYSEGEWRSFGWDVEVAARRAGIETRPAEGIGSHRRVNVAYDGFVSANLGALLSTGEIPLLQGIVASLSAVLLGDALGDRRLHPETALVLVLIVLGRTTVYRDRAKAQARVDRVREAVARIWNDGWLLCAPTTTFPALGHGLVFRTPGCMVFAKLGNLVDATAMAVPFGFHPGGLPRSVQILGPPGSEGAVLRAAELLEVPCDGRSRPSGWGILPKEAGLPARAGEPGTHARIDRR